jgi:hypothetical protein
MEPTHPYRKSAGCLRSCCRRSAGAPPRRSPGTSTSNGARPRPGPATRGAGSESIRHGYNRRCSTSAGIGASSTQQTPRVVNAWRSAAVEGPDSLSPVRSPVAALALAGSICKCRTARDPKWLTPGSSRTTTRAVDGRMLFAVARPPGDVLGRTSRCARSRPLARSAVARSVELSRKGRSANHPIPCSANLTLGLRQNEALMMRGSRCVRTRATVVWRRCRSWT